MNLLAILVWAMLLWIVLSPLVTLAHALGFRCRPLAWAIWFAMLPAWIVVFASRYVFAESAVRAAGDADHLSGVWTFLDTIDNPLTGDGGHQERCRAAGIAPESFAGKVEWIKRNGGNHAAYMWFGVSAGEDYPLLRRVLEIGFEPFFGWNTKGPQLGRCKYSFGLRWKRE
ncbi:MAG: hypothetical protein AB1642_13430 [Pseudomonadota bacterium]